VLRSGGGGEGASKGSLRLGGIEAGESGGGLAVGQTKKLTAMVYGRSGRGGGSGALCACVVCVVVLAWGGVRE
jgi:hypothetical protein